MAALWIIQEQARLSSDRSRAAQYEAHLHFERIRRWVLFQSCMCVCVCICVCSLCSPKASIALIKQMCEARVARESLSFQRVRPCTARAPIPMLAAMLRFREKSVKRSIKQYFANGFFCHCARAGKLNFFFLFRELKWDYRNSMLRDFFSAGIEHFNLLSSFRISFAIVLRSGNNEFQVV